MTKAFSSAKRADPLPEPSGFIPASAGGGMPMFPPMRAWRILCTRTGGSIALVTFYRWLRNGRIYSIRLGQRIFIPQPALEDAIKQCLAGERF